MEINQIQIEYQNEKSVEWKRIKKNRRNETNKILKVNCEQIIEWINLKPDILHVEYWFNDYYNQQQIINISYIICYM